jgi:hypothetical protein
MPFMAVAPSIQQQTEREEKEAIFVVNKLPMRSAITPCTDSFE